MLKILMKFSFVPQASFCQLSFQDKDQDQDFTFNFENRTEFYTCKGPTKFCLDPRTPLRIIVSTDRAHRCKQT